MDVEKDPERWEYSARALHAFYLDQGLHGQAVGLARKTHEKAGTASTAAMLAETELALNNNAEAEKMLAALDKDGKSTPMTRTLWGVAQARLGKAQAAKKLAQGISLGDDAGPQLAYSYARLSAATGSADAALAALQKCFETLPPSRLENFKEHAKACPEFAALASTPKFAKVLETESQVAESKCSSGSGCAGCPTRGKCDKAPEEK
jgi:tetratricopeptide (TPR) repeat protein